ncbi:prenylcysteine oxidase 1 [Lasioglossum baleicum]|uniref:prenylcysteine oxidase 1 n=1 Tax=Lasioglossum baleicum TaxID=434251 RepID=UPI003FCD9298
MELRIIFSFILLLESVLSFENCKPNIAIIGGGIGGASSSHFLTELFESNLSIDLYEAKTIGGRLATVQIDENEFEAGGAIIHPQNKYMQEFVKLLGLEHRISTDDNKVGIWNGNEFVFEESNWEVISFAKLLYRYGIQPFSLNRFVQSILNDFAKIYDVQNSGESFENVTGLLSAMNNGFPKLLQTSIKHHLLNLGYSEQMIDELVKSTLVVNYGQDTSVHSFVGSVSIAGAGFNLWSIKGGNKKVPEHLIYRNKNINIIPSYVVKIINAPQENGRQSYEVHYHNKDSTIIMKSIYDIVIVATPLTSDQQYPITFEGFPNNNFHGAEKYHRTIATFVKADLKPYYFGSAEEIDTILSCEPNKTIVNSVGRLNSVEGPIKDSKVWKIFSNAPLKSGVLNEMFSNIDETKEISWKAYPEYSTYVHDAKFKLHNALYHVNAIEWAASAMEMSAIGGRNVAILSHKDFSEKCYRNEINKATIHANTPSIEL